MAKAKRRTCQLQKFPLWSGEGGTVAHFFPHHDLGLLLPLVDEVSKATYPAVHSTVLHRIVPSKMPATHLGPACGIHRVQKSQASNLKEAPVLRPENNVLLRPKRDIHRDRLTDLRRFL